MNLLERVYETIKKHHMVRPGEKLVVGVSGGPDSVALLDILYCLMDRLQITLHVAHLNHMFRGEEAREDACFVEKLAGLYNLPVTVKNFDVPAYKKRFGFSSQVAARKVRYEFFKEVAGREVAGKVTLAHHANDQAETIMLHFLRGTGLAGLRGMLPVRDDFYIRPLLYIMRADIERYCRDRGLAFRVDSSNLKTDYIRNKIRINLLPVLEKEYNQGLVAAITRLGEISREEENYLEMQAQEAYNELIISHAAGELQLKLKEFCQQPVVLQRRILRRAWYEVTGNYKDLTYDHVERTLELLSKQAAGIELELPKGILVKKSYTGFSLITGKHKPEEVNPYCYEVWIPGHTYIPEIKRTLHSEILLRENFKESLSRLPQNEVILDYDRVEMPLYVRGRRPGDAFKPLGLGGTMKLKKFFINQKVPMEERSRIPLIEGGGKIIWVGGMQIAENVKINKETKKILYLKLH